MGFLNSIFVVCVTFVASQSAGGPPGNDTPAASELSGWQSAASSPDIEADYIQAQKYIQQELNFEAENLLLSIVAKNAEHLPALKALSDLYDGTTMNRDFRFYYVDALIDKLDTKLCAPVVEDLYKSIMSSASNALQFDMMFKYLEKFNEISSGQDDLTVQKMEIRAYLTTQQWKKALKILKKLFKGGRPDGRPVHVDMAKILLNLGADKNTTEAQATKYLQEAQKVLIHGLSTTAPIDPDMFYMLLNFFHRKEQSGFNLTSLPAVQKYVVEEGWVKNATIEYKSTRPAGWKVPRYTIGYNEDGTPDWSPVHECLRARHPCTFVGGDKNIPSMLGWNTDLWGEDYLKEKAGFAQMMVESRIDSTRKFGSGNNYITLNFSDTLEAFRTNSIPNLYLALRQSTQHAPYNPPLNLLKDDIPIPSFIPARVVSINLWMSGNQKADAPLEPLEQTTKSALHVDSKDNINVLVKGRKKFVLYGPEDAEKLYPVGRLAGVMPFGKILYGDPSPQDVNENFAMVNPDFPEYDLFPKSKTLNPVELEVNAGDMLYLPVGWFHEVQTWGPTLGVNYWYLTPDDTSPNDGGTKG